MKFSHGINALKSSQAMCHINDQQKINVLEGGCVPLIETNMGSDHKSLQYMPVSAFGVFSLLITSWAVGEQSKLEQSILPL
jgi:hypothetical protein